MIVPVEHVSENEIEDGSVTAAKIGTSAVTADKIAASAVTTPKVNATAVTAAKVAPSAVTTTKIAAAAVTSAKLASDALALINAKVAKTGDDVTGRLTVINSDDNGACYVSQSGANGASLLVDGHTDVAPVVYLINTGTSYSLAIEGTAIFDFTVSKAGDVFIAGECSALSFFDRTPHYKGDAVAEILKIQDINGEIDHSTLPEFVKAKKVKKVYEKHDVIKERQASKIVDIPTKVETVMNVGGKHVKRIKTEIRPTPVKLFNEVELYDDKGEPFLDDDGNQVMHQMPIMEKYTESENVLVGEETVTERNLGNMISVLTVAVQQISKRLGSLEAR